MMSKEEFHEHQNGLVRERKAVKAMTKSGLFCPLCCHQVLPSEMQMHHVAGRRNSDVQISICIRCHVLLTRNQRFWPENWTKVGKPPKEKAEFLRLAKQDIDNLLEREIRRNEWEEGKEIIHG